VPTFDDDDDSLSFEAPDLTDILAFLDGDVADDDGGIAEADDDYDEDGGIVKASDGNITKAAADDYGSFEKSDDSIVMANVDDDGSITKDDDDDSIVMASVDGDDDVGDQVSILQNSVSAENLTDEFSSSPFLTNFWPKNKSDKFIFILLNKFLCVQ
jgi:hypothetical protein